MRLLACCADIENIDKYAKKSTISYISITHQRQNDTTKGFGDEGDIFRCLQAQPDGFRAQTADNDRGIRNGSAMTISF